MERTLEISPSPTSGLLASPKSFELLDARIDNLSQASALSRIFAPHHGLGCRQVFFVNAHCLNVATEDAAYRADLRQADLVLPDGTGVRWGARWHGIQVTANLNGTDLFLPLCEKAAREGLSLYLLGGESGVAMDAAHAMQARFPNLQVAGYRDGFFEPDEHASIVDEINASGADLLLVGLGVPLQEKWIHQHATRLKVRSALAVGGLFDYYAERVSRAPVLVRRLGQEWVWRLVQEPRRLARRYLIGNLQFLWRVWTARTSGNDSWFGQLMLNARKRWALSRSRRQARVQRSLDLLLVIPGLLALAPLFVFMTILIRLDSPGPAFFVQKRVGRYGRVFSFYKFRSMYVDAEQRRKTLENSNEMAGGVLFKMKHDPRVTRMGRLLRRSSLDELPQLWNVLKGDMSLVGPRPALPSEVAQYSAADRRRLCGVPGITCSWQVSGRSDIPFEQQVELDSRYLQQPTAASYLELLIKTIPAVLSGRGAY